jgi:8-oxo-dGTP pyrophosphatase MutT (NUDIX family)
METLVKESDKRKVAAFIPYRHTENGYEFFMQKRTLDAPTSPGLLGLFGGGVEGEETYEEGAIREISEELVYVPQRLVFFSKFEHAKAIFHVFIEEVGVDFESKVTVSEGEYGTFLTIDTTTDWRQFTHTVFTVMPSLVDFLSQ